MAALGIPTTRSLAAVTTGETVLRDRPLPGAVLTRVAQSHVRIGTFQFFAARGDVEATRHLADYIIARHYPKAAHEDNPSLALLNPCDRAPGRPGRQVGARRFHSWCDEHRQLSIVGETIDYGPCAFMDTYHPETVFSSIDHFRRYAYGNQPRIAQWNLARFAETLLPLIAEDTNAAVEVAQTTLASFMPLFEHAFAAGLRRSWDCFDPKPVTRCLPKTCSTGWLRTASTSH